MSTGIQYVVDGIAFGSLFALMALGLALLFSVMGLMNFAYGELIMAGGFTMYYTRDYGWGAMVVITIVVVVVLSVLMELVAFRPLRNASPITLLISSFAVSYGLQQLGWMAPVYVAETEAELEAVRRSVARGCPFGSEAWRGGMVARYGLEHTVRPQGRPRKTRKAETSNNESRPLF